MRRVLLDPTHERSPAIRQRLPRLGSLEGKTVGVLGLSYKANTDDVRDSPSIDIIRKLQDRGARIRCYDPQAMENARQVLKDVTFCSN